MTQHAARIVAEKTPQEPLKILTVDLSIADIPGKDPQRFKELLEDARFADEHFDLKDKKNRTDNKEIFEEVLGEVGDESEGKVTPGGTSGNMLYTMCGLLNRPGKHDVEVQFHTVNGKGTHQQMLTNSISGNGITPVLMQKEGVTPEYARSIGQDPDPDHEILDDKKYLIYPGNAKEILSVDSDAHKQLRAEAKQSDVLLLQGSMWEKFDPRVADSLMKLRQQCNKRLWLSFPTGADFIERHTPGLDVRNRFHFMLPSAELVLSNMAELNAILKVPDPKKETISPEEKRRREAMAATKEERVQRARKQLDGTLEEELTGIDPETQENILELQQIFREERERKLRDVDECRLRAGESVGHPQTAFITLSGMGAVVVTADSITRFHPRRDIIKKGETHFKVGAGDAATGAFLAAYQAGVDSKEAGKLAMDVVARKMLKLGARLKNIGTVLDDIVEDTKKEGATDEAKEVAAVAEQVRDYRDRAQGQAAGPTGP